MVKRLIVNLVLEYGGRATKSLANAYKRVVAGEGMYRILYTYRAECFKNMSISEI